MKKNPKIGGSNTPLDGHDLQEAGIILSRPPKGKCRVLNIFVNPETGKLEAKYVDTPETKNYGE